VEEHSNVEVDGKRIVPEDEEIFLAVNKPVGIVCTTTDRYRHREQNIVDLVHYPKRVYPIGRLDKDSEGLILMTNRGEIVDRILRGSNGHEKEYMVSVEKPVTEEFLQSLRTGIPMMDTVTRPCTAEKISNHQFRIVLTQGLNRQIRRMCDYCGYHVRTLKRVRIMNISLGDLKTGTYRRLTEAEVRGLKELCHESGRMEQTNGINNRRSSRKSSVITERDCVS
jgi:pseudouridine synthase